MRAQPILKDDLHEVVILPPLGHGRPTHGHVEWPPDSYMPSHVAPRWLRRATHLVDVAAVA